MLKLYEEFITFDKLYDIIKQIENRINYWFSEKGSLGKDSTLIEIDKNLTDKYKTRSISFNFFNDNYMYQCILTINIETNDKCKISLKRYDLDNQKLIDKIQDEINLNDIKEDYIISKISELEEKDENPDKNKLEYDKEIDIPEKENDEQVDEIEEGEGDEDLGFGEEGEEELEF